MARHRNNRLTDAEVAILTVIWDRGPSTVRQIRDSLSAQESGIDDTSVYRLMQIATDKGLLLCDKKHHPQVYFAAQEQEDVQQQLLRDSGRAHPHIVHLRGEED